VTTRGKYAPRARAREAPQDAADDPRAQAIAEAQRALFAAKRALKVKRARESLKDFIELMWADPEFPDDSDHSLFDCEPHHRILIDMVEKIERREMLRAGCSMPPQHGKSLILSRFGLAWILGRNPGWRVLFATYADTLAETRGDELRTVLESGAFREVFPKAVLKKGSRNKTEMVFVAGGSVNLVGRGSGTTGRPADLFIIDDPYKGDEEAGSATIRESVRAWYAGVAQTRCPVWAPILIVHTRWNEDDLLGWLTDPEHPANRANPERAKRWKYINLPSPVSDAALAEALGLEVGSALWPKRFPLHHLAEIRENDARLYAALYLGQPAPEDGDFFRAEHFHLYQPGDLPKNLRMYAASDHAVSEKQRADWTVLGSVGVCEKGIVWVMPDLFWEQAAADKVVEAMLKHEKRHPHLWWRAGRDHITKSIGPFLRKRMQETQTFINLIEEPETGDKVRKAQAIQARMSGGGVRFPAGAPWLTKARAEMLKFPHAKHDDFVDFMSLVGRGLRTLLSAPKAVANDDRPKTGTIHWIKWAAKQDSAAGADRNRLATM
jgi:predicted phage terminase large subunit-like protein